MSFAFPVSLNVAGRRCVVVGGGSLADDKARSLAAAGAVVVAVPADAYQEHMLDGAFLVISTGEDDTDPAALAAAARARGALVNVMDDILHCDFAFPAIVRRGDVQVAISTGGGAPALAGALRRRLDATLPSGLGVLADAMRRAREAALPRQVPFAEWAARWRAVVDDLDDLLALADDGHTDAIQERILAAVRGETA